ncbi:hypothetical protein VTO42DRAFT_7807 [Malbranchea cinnamomea]
MAKGKSSGMAQSHLRARLSYLYNATTLLQSAASRNAGSTDTAPSTLIMPESTSASLSRTNIRGVSRIARQYASQLRSVSLKSQLRLSRDEKRSLCKRCDTLLVAGTSCSEEIENKSRGGKKPWANVLVVTCWTCGAQKRFPQTQKRSLRLVERKKMDKKLAADREAAVGTDAPAT